MNDLFAAASGNDCRVEQLSEGTFLMRNYALPYAEDLIAEIAKLEQVSPRRIMSTPGGKAMSVAMTNCGDWGWLSDQHGYRYGAVDPVTSRPWPTMPVLFSYLGVKAAAATGFGRFCADAAIVNCYEPGAKMSLHQDINERDFAQPIVSISLGLSAVFLLGGNQRGDKVWRLPLHHGDLVVWGGCDRKRFHGVMPIANGKHPVCGSRRFNITLRKTH